MKKHLIYLLVIFIACMLLVAVQRTKAEAPEGKQLTIQEYAEMRVEHEFGEGQWESFNKIVMKESNWRVTGAHYPSGYTRDGIKSSASGLFGFLDSTWSSVGCEKTFNQYLQVDCGIKYIKLRYGSPSKAFSFHILNGYY